MNNDHLRQLLTLANNFYIDGDDKSVELIHKLIRSHITTPSYKTAQQVLPTIHLIRHGSTDYNSNGSNDSSERLRGWLDIPLNIDGIVAAERLAQYFYTLKVAKIISSDLLRAQHTAIPIARYTKAPLVLSPQLRPFNLGFCMGKPVNEYIPVMIDHIKNDHKIPPGSTENFHTFQTRFLSKIVELMNEAKNQPQDGAIIVVAHSRNTRCMRDFILSGGNDIENITKTTLLQKDDPVKTAGFMTIQFDGQKWNLVDLDKNDFSSQNKENEGK